MRAGLEQAQKFAESPAMRELNAQLQKWDDSAVKRELFEMAQKLENSPAWQDVIERVKNAPPTTQGLRELIQKLKEQYTKDHEPPPRKRNPGGRPLRLTQEQIKQGRAKLKSRPDLVAKPKAAMKWLRDELDLPSSVDDSTLRRHIINPIAKPPT